jgi:RNA polymerase sigma-70 factor (ECF subfamily)
MLRVTPQTADGVERFRLEGRLAGAYVAELGRVLQPSLTSPREVALDLRGLTFVDAEGADLLRTLAARNVEIHGCSGFVAHLLALPMNRSSAERAAWNEIVETLAERHTAASSLRSASHEAALLERLQAGDEAACEPFVRAAGGRLLAIARRLLGREKDARHVVEETFKDAFRSLQIRSESLRPVALHRALIHRALKTLRREVEQAGPAHETLLLRFDLAGRHAAPVADWALPEPAQMLAGPLTERVQSVLSKLPPPHRASFLLSDVEELTAEQVATILPLTPAEVKGHLHQARQMLREELAPLLGAAPAAQS